MSRWKGITTINYLQETDEKLVVGLGFFDCLHIGHIKLINEVKRLANKYDAKSGIFTFSNNPFIVLNKDTKQIYNFEERVFKLNSLMVDYCLYAQFDNDFANLQPLQFLDNLLKNKQIKAIVVGSDYTFGKLGKGDTMLLNDWCNNNGIELSIVDFAVDNGIKISSTSIRELLSDGNLKKANEYLGQAYFVMGQVKTGRKEGKNIGFATANISLDSDKIIIKKGVYYTRVLLDGIWYKAVTNVGEHPTFDDYNANIESHILYYDNSLYGKKIVVSFLEYIREIKKFADKTQLANQISNDIKFALSNKN